MFSGDKVSLAAAVKNVQFFYMKSCIFIYTSLPVVYAFFIGQTNLKCALVAVPTQDLLYI